MTALSSNFTYKLSIQGFSLVEPSVIALLPILTTNLRVAKCSCSGLLGCLSAFIGDIEVNYTKLEVNSQTIGLMSGIRESNPSLHLGKVVLSHSTNPANINKRQISIAY